MAYDGVEMGGRGEEGEMKYEQGRNCSPSCDPVLLALGCGL